MKKTELLIPVGNYDCLLAAIHNGADAVYLGGKKFGARAYSNNFSSDEMIEAIKLCHLYGVKIYVTVNTMIFNEEIDEIMDYIYFLYENNVDALIMQDIGIIKLVRNLLPDLEIHVSTQAHNHNTDGISYFKKLGCTRVVFDRESSLEEISNINVDIEKEVFIYGALCICYSGNCLFSALNGGRSANRGMCVGSCRLPYSLAINDKIVDSGYLLSTKDLNTTNKIKQLLDANIDSLKVEGRMKGPEYVSCVTKIYRRLIDDYYNNINPVITEKEITDLYKVYNREFTEGYLFNENSIINKKSSNHQGIKIGTVVSGTNKRILIKLCEDIHQEDAIRIDGSNMGMYLNTLYDKKGLLISMAKKGDIIQIDNKERIMVKDFIGHDVLKTVDFLLNKELLNYKEKKIPIQISFKAHLDDVMILTFDDGNNTVTVKSNNIIEKAKTSAMDKNRINEQLMKLGNTPFIAKNISIEMDENLFISIKDLNDIRREATSLLIECRYGKKRNKKKRDIKENIIKTSDSKISILVRNKEQLDIALRNNIDMIYVTNEELYNEYKDNKNIYLRLDRVIKEHKEYNNERLLCTELGAIYKYSKNNMVNSDYYLNNGNDYTINTLKSMGSNINTLSVELNTEQLRQIKNKSDTEVIVYGYLECMIIKNDIFNVNNRKIELINNKKKRYRILSDGEYTHIFNKEPINIVDKIDRFKGFRYYRIELLLETPMQVQSIINKVKDMI